MLSGGVSLLDSDKLICRGLWSISQLTKLKGWKRNLTSLRLLNRTTASLSESNNDNNHHIMGVIVL